jgi:hypothetical protein
MSVRTPILTTSSETWASAAGEDDVAAANAASTIMFMAEITNVLPHVRRFGRLVDRENSSAGPPLLQLIRSLRQRGRCDQAAKRI